MSSSWCPVESDIHMNNAIVMPLCILGRVLRPIACIAAIALSVACAADEARWIAEDLPPGIKATSEKNCPVFARSFVLGEVPAVAMAKVAGLGFFEVDINGRKLGDQALTPAACDFARQVYFYEWDAAPLLRRGENEIRITCAPGYSDDFFEYGWRRVAEYPKRAWMELDLGEREIVTDSSWKYSPRSKVTSSSIYLGERQDLSFEPSEWFSAKVVGDEDMQEVIHRVECLWPEPPSAPALVRYDGAPVRFYDPRVPKSVTRLGGAFIVDAGVNRAGALELRVKGAKGDVVKVFFAEDRDPATGDIDPRTNRTPEPVRDEFVLAGDPAGERLMPRFTYHGFRFCRVEGVRDLGPGDVVCWAFGAVVAETGSFECSDPFLNRFHAAAKNSMRSNFASYPTDCCMRNERTPCQMDSQAYEEAAMFNFDMRRFYGTWLDNIAFGGIGGTMNPDWQGDGVVLPWRLYSFYGDRGVLAKNYPFAKKKLELMLAANPDGVVTNGFGDWCAPNDGAKGYLSAFSRVAEANTALLAMCCDAMSKSADVLGFECDAARFRAAYGRIKAAYNAKFFDAAKCAYSDGDQLVTSLAVAAGFADGEAKDGACRAMAARIRGRDRGKFTVGIFGLRHLGEVLADCGEADLFISMMKGPEYPSFGYMFDNFDATSLWEQWHPYGEMNTHNHAMMAGAETWFFTRILGIRIKNGGKDVEFKPVFPDSLEWAKGSVRLPCGLVEVEWRREGGKPVYHSKIREEK